MDVSCNKSNKLQHIHQLYISRAGGGDSSQRQVLLIKIIKEVIFPPKEFFSIEVTSEYLFIIYELTVLDSLASSAGDVHCLSETVASAMFDSEPLGYFGSTTRRSIEVICFNEFQLRMNAKIKTLTQLRQGGPHVLVLRDHPAQRVLQHRGHVRIPLRRL